MSTKANLVIEQGADFQTPVMLTDENGEDLITTVFVANASLRKYYGSTNSWEIGTTLANGVLTLVMSAIETANVAPGRYVWDVQIRNTSTNTVSRLVEGIVTVTPRVT